MASTDYQRGYEAAFAEIYAAIDSEDHPANCGDCRSCGVIRTVIEDTFIRLGEKLTREEFYALAGIVGAVNSRKTVSGGETEAAGEL